MTQPSFPLPEFLRAFAVQDTPNLMFLFGAGTSVRSGIPSAADMVWQFKREVFASETGTSKLALRDVRSEHVRQRLQSYFDAKGTCPARGAGEEYSRYFEMCYPSQADRRSFIRNTARGAAPTIGHECLAVLLAAGECRWVWTANFDDLIERAERADAANRLVVASEESADRINTASEDGLWPILVKLHGDYKYDSLQNTAAELRRLDDKLRSHLTRSCTSHGLVVVGYSGRDESVMSAVEEAARGGGFPRGLYWCLMPGERPDDRVSRLVEKAHNSSGRGGFVETDGFDDLMYRLYRQCSLQDDSVDRKAADLFERRRPFALSRTDRSAEPIKLSAIRVIDYPDAHFRFQTSVENWAELRARIGESNIVAGLLRGNALAFGERSEIQRAFDSRVTGPLELVGFESRELTHGNSVAIGLFYDLVTKSMTRDYGLVLLGRRTFFIPADDERVLRAHFEFRHAGSPHRVLQARRQGDVIVCEAVRVQLEYHDGSLWFVVEPTVVVTRDGRTVAEKDRRQAVVNEVLSGRYNAASHEMLLFWLSYLKCIRDPIAFSLLPADRGGTKIVLDSHYAFSSARTPEGR